MFDVGLNTHCHIAGLKLFVLLANSVEIITWRGHTTGCFVCFTGSRGRKLETKIRLGRHQVCGNSFEWTENPDLGTTYYGFNNFVFVLLLCSSVYNILVKDGEKGNIDERRVNMLKSQVIQLERQVRLARSKHFRFLFKKKTNFIVRKWETGRHGSWWSSWKVWKKWKLFFGGARL